MKGARINFKDLKGEAARGLIGVALGVVLGSISIVFSRPRSGERTWRDRSAN